MKTSDLDIRYIVRHEFPGKNLFEIMLSKSAFHLYIKILIITLIACLYEAPGWLEAGLFTSRFTAMHGPIFKVLAVATFSLLSVVGIYISKRNIIYLDDLIFIAILVFLNMYKWKQAKQVTEAFEALAKDADPLESTGDLYYTEPGREDSQAFNMYPLDKIPEDRDELVHKINRPEHYDYTPDDIPGYLAQPAITRLEGLRDKIQRDKNYRYNATVRPFDTKDIPGSPEPIKTNTRTPIDDLFRKGGQNQAYKLADEVLTVLESCPDNLRSAQMDSHKALEPALSHQRRNGAGNSKYRFLSEPEPNLFKREKGVAKCTDNTNEKRTKSLQRLIGGPVVDDPNIIFNRLVKARLEDDRATIREYRSLYNLCQPGVGLNLEKRQCLDPGLGTQGLRYKDFIAEINNADREANGGPLAEPKPVETPLPDDELKPYREPLKNKATFKDIQLRDLDFEASEKDNIFTPRDQRLRLADGYSFSQADGINAKLGGNSIRLFDSCTNYSIPSPDSLKRVSDNCARRLDGSCLSD
jgi:hypothetical protein